MAYEAQNNDQVKDLDYGQEELLFQIATQAFDKIVVKEGLVLAHLDYFQETKPDPVWSSGAVRHDGDQVR